MRYYRFVFSRPNSPDIYWEDILAQNQKAARAKWTLIKATYGFKVRLLYVIRPAESTTQLRNLANLLYNA